MNNCCNSVFYEDDMNRWESCPSTALANADNFYTKHQIDEMLEDIETSGTCECDYDLIDDMIESATSAFSSDLSALSGTVGQLSSDMQEKADKSEIPSLDGYATEQWVENQGYLTEHQPLKTINNISLVGTGNIEIGTGGTIDLSDYYTKSETNNVVNNATSGKSDTSAVTVVSDALASHTGNTAMHITSNEKYNWNTAYNNYFDKNNIFCGTEAEFYAATSGGTNINPNVIYFIHQ